MVVASRRRREGADEPESVRGGLDDPVDRLVGLLVVHEVALAALAQVQRAESCSSQSSSSARSASNGGLASGANAATSSAIAASAPCVDRRPGVGRMVGSDGVEASTKRASETFLHATSARPRSGSAKRSAVRACWGTTVRRGRARPSRGSRCTWPPVAVDRALLPSRISVASRARRWPREQAQALVGRGGDQQRAVVLDVREPDHACGDVGCCRA